MNALHWAHERLRGRSCSSCWTTVSHLTFTYELSSQIHYITLSSVTICLMTGSVCLFLCAGCYLRMWRTAHLLSLRLAERRAAAFSSKPPSSSSSSSSSRPQAEKLRRRRQREEAILSGQHGVSRREAPRQDNSCKHKHPESKVWKHLYQTNSHYTEKTIYWRWFEVSPFCADIWGSERSGRFV